VFAKTFATASGKKVIAILQQTYLDKPSFVPGQDHSLEIGYFREGQNAVIRQMLAAIERGKLRT
jgi:hypothetical protein